MQDDFDDGGIDLPDDEIEGDLGDLEGSDADAEMDLLIVEETVVSAAPARAAAPKRAPARALTPAPPAPAAKPKAKAKPAATAKAKPKPKAKKARGRRR
jgi:hypothetical protein